MTFLPELDIITGALGQTDTGLDWLFKGDFSIYPDESAPIASPIALDVGYLVVTQDASNDFKFTGGELQRDKLSSWLLAYLNYGDSGNSKLPVTRIPGLAMYLEDIRTTTNDTIVGFSTNANDPGDGTTAAGGLALFNGRVYINVSPILYADGDNLNLITRNQGGFVFDDDTNELLWIVNDGEGTPLYPFLSEVTTVDQSILDKWRLADLVANGYSVFGVRDLDLSTPGTGTGTSKIASPVAGNEWVTTGDYVFTIDLTTLPSSSSTRYALQFVDNSNYIFLQIDSSGNYQLRKNEAASFSTLASAAGVLAGGEKLTCLVNDGQFTAFYDDIQAFQVTDTTFNPCTLGKLLILGPSTVHANLEARTLDGVANVSSANHPGYGLATNVLPGPRTAGDLFTHEADCVLSWDLVARPTSGQVWVRFRKQDNNNFWLLQVNNSGDLRLFESIAGTPNSRALVAGVLSGGERIVIICNDETITGYYDNTEAWSYGSAANFKTETAGEINSLGAGGEISNLISRPYDFNAANPNTGGAAEAKRALDALGA